MNISNDGWFVRGGGDQPVQSSSELIQHLVICKFRAIENRIGIVRSVNTGISGFIKPDGTVQTEALTGTLPAAVKDRQTVAGFLTDRVYLDGRITIYSQIGDAFAIITTILTALLLTDGLYCQLRARKEAKAHIKVIN